MSERHGASRRWHAEPGASAQPLTTHIFSLDDALACSKTAKGVISRCFGHGLDLQSEPMASPWMEEAFDDVAL